MPGNVLATAVVAGLALQTIYYTVLVLGLAARISSRLAIMEFKVDELWSRARLPGEEM